MDCGGSFSLGNNRGCREKAVKYSDIGTVIGFVCSVVTFMQLQYKTFKSFPILGASQTEIKMCQKVKCGLGLYQV